MKLTASVLVASVLALTTPMTLAQDGGGIETLSTIVEPSPVRAIEHYDLEKKKDNLAIEGYDPVAYFKEGGGKATKGKKSISTTYKQVTIPSQAKRTASYSSRTLRSTSPRTAGGVPGQ